MQILITNDDGVFSPGIAALANAFLEWGDVCVAAPLTEQSGVSQAITFLTPLTVKEVVLNNRSWGYAVSGTPVDCVKIGIDQLCPVRPDLVISGINNGLNAGANILYSGTVGAALEGAYQGITSVAVSLQFLPKNDAETFCRAAEIAKTVIARLLQKNNRPGELFNLNIPLSFLEHPSSEKIRVVPVDSGLYWDQYEKRVDPTQRPYYWLSGRPYYKQIVPADSPLTDIQLVSDGFVTISPLDFNLTKHAKLDEMLDWSFESIAFDAQEPLAGPLSNAAPSSTAPTDSIRPHDSFPSGMPNFQLRRQVHVDKTPPKASRKEE